MRLLWKIVCLPVPIFRAVGRWLVSKPYLLEQSFPAVQALLAAVLATAELLLPGVFEQTSIGHQLDRGPQLGWALMLLFGGITTLYGLVKRRRNAEIVGLIALGATLMIDSYIVFYAFGGPRGSIIGTVLAALALSCFTRAGQLHWERGRLIKELAAVQRFVEHEDEDGEE